MPQILPMRARRPDEAPQQACHQGNAQAIAGEDVQIPDGVFIRPVLERFGQLAGGDERDDGQRDGPVQQPQQRVVYAMGLGLGMQLVTSLQNAMRPL